MKYNPLHMLAFILLGFVTILAVTSVFWTPYAFDEPHFANKLASPSSEFWLGTDEIGRDLASRLMIGIRYSLFISVISIAVGAMIGTSIGIYAALYPKSERFISHMNDFLLAFPALLTALLIVAKYGPGMTSAMIAIALFNVPVFARLTRAAAKQIIQKPFVLASRAMGQNRFWIAVDHVIPNLRSILTIQMSSQMALAILAESGFSYLGIGVQVPHPSLGRMLADAENFIYTHPSLAIIPGIAIVLCVFSLNIFTDYLRDKWDPHSTYR